MTIDQGGEDGGVFMQRVVARWPDECNMYQNQSLGAILCHTGSGCSSPPIHQIVSHWMHSSKTLSMYPCMKSVDAQVLSLAKVPSGPW